MLVPVLGLLFDLGEGATELFLDGSFLFPGFPEGGGDFINFLDDVIHHLRIQVDLRDDFFHDGFLLFFFLLELGPRFFGEVGRREFLLDPLQFFLLRLQVADVFEKLLGFFLFVFLFLFFGIADLDDIEHTDLALFDLLPDRQNFVDGDGAVGDGGDDLLLPFFDPFGDFHFSLAGEQRDGPHFTQVHADRVVDGNGIDLGDLDFLFVVGGTLFVLVSVFFVGIELFPFQGRIDDIDLVFPEQVHQVIDLLRGHKVGRQHVVDFFVGQVTFLFALRNQLIDFRYVCQFFHIGHRLGFSSLNLLVNPVPRSQGVPEAFSAGGQGHLNFL